MPPSTLNAHKCRYDDARLGKVRHWTGSSAELPRRERTRREILRSLALAALICAGQAGKAHSQPAPTGAVDATGGAPPTVSLEQPEQNWATQSTMTGDWGGVRTSLSEAGFDFKAAYVGEYAYAFSGGKRIGGDYAQQLRFGMDMDLAKVVGLRGARFDVTFNAREGRSTSADFVGNKLATQEIYGDGNNFRLAELSYDQSLLGNALDVKAGYLVLGSDFGRTPSLCSFQNSGFCAHPKSLVNNSGWTDYPIGKWAARVRVTLPADIYAEIGVYDVNPSYEDHNNGFKVSLQGSTGVIIPVEFGKTVTFGPAAMPGHYKLGGYYDSSEVPDEENPNSKFSGRYGGYLLADQMVCSFAPGTDRGLIVVVNATVSDIRTAQIPSYFVGALVAQGPFAARPHDFLGIGFIRATVNSNAVSRQEVLLAARGVENPMLELGENDVELSYGLQATPWMLIHPNLQFIGNPGAFSFKHVPNAWVFGAQIELTL